MDLYMPIYYQSPKRSLVKQFISPRAQISLGFWIRKCIKGQIGMEWIGIYNGIKEKQALFANLYSMIRNGREKNTKFADIIAAFLL